MKYVILLLVLTNSLLAQQTKPICYPPYFEAIVVGITIDRDVVKIYGKGLFSDNLGHGGGRYYTDSTLSVTLIVTIGVDHVIESVEFLDGLQFPKSAGNNIRQFITPRLNRRDGFFGLRIGSSRNDVISELGKPNKSPTTDGYYCYESDYKSDCTISSYVAFTFTNDKVVKIEFYNGE